MQDNTVLKVGRRIAGKNLTVERFLKRHYRGVKARLEKRYQGHNFVYFWSGAKRNNRVGIYLRGACDLGAIFACEPLIQEELNGVCCIYRGGFGVSSSRTDLILQSLQEWPKEGLQPVIENLKLNPAYFKPHLFDPNFTVHGAHGPEKFPKSVVIFSLAPDLVRTVYRHREYGFLVDPGGWWLNQSMGDVLSDLSAVTWFNKTFEKVGRISVEESMANFTRIIQLLRERTGARIMVFNMLTVEPGDTTYNYQFVRDSLVIRRREFDIALWELSRQLDFSVVDIDKILKTLGVQEQVDFAHWPLDRFEPVAREVVRIMKDMGLFD